MNILTNSLLITALSVVNLSACVLADYEIYQVNDQAQDYQQFQDNLKATQEGNIEAQYNLGVDYLNGLRTEESDFLEEDATIQYSDNVFPFVPSSNYTSQNMPDYDYEGYPS